MSTSPRPTTASPSSSPSQQDHLTLPSAPNMHMNNSHNPSFPIKHSTPIRKGEGPFCSPRKMLMLLEEGRVRRQIDTLNQSKKQVNARFLNTLPLDLISPRSSSLRDYWVEEEGWRNMGVSERGTQTGPSLNLSHSEGGLRSGEELSDKNETIARRPPSMTKAPNVPRYHAISPPPISTQAKEEAETCVWCQVGPRLQCNCSSETEIVLPDPQSLSPPSRKNQVKPPQKSASSPYEIGSSYHQPTTPSASPSPSPIRNAIREKGKESQNVSTPSQKAAIPPRLHARLTGNIQSQAQTPALPPLPARAAAFLRQAQDLHLQGLALRLWNRQIAHRLHLSDPHACNTLLDTLARHICADTDIDTSTNVNTGMSADTTTVSGLDTGNDGDVHVRALHAGHFFIPDFICPEAVLDQPLDLPEPSTGSRGDSDSDSDSDADAGASASEKGSVASW